VNLFFETSLQWQTALYRRAVIMYVQWSPTVNTATWTCQRRTTLSTWCCRLSTLWDWRSLLVVTRISPSVTVLSFCLISQSDFVCFHRYLIDHIMTMTQWHN